jgi:hypothetical protein
MRHKLYINLEYLATVVDNSRTTMKPMGARYWQLQYGTVCVCLLREHSWRTFKLHVAKCALLNSAGTIFAELHVEYRVPKIRRCRGDNP